MAKKINLGKVGITTAGAYDPNKAYERLTCVTYNYESWVSTKDVPVGNSPQDGSEYWQKMSARGAQGIQGEKGEQGNQGPQGPQGNSGYQGAAGELEVVNNLTRGGESSALSAEQGKVLKQEITELSAEIDAIVGKTLQESNVEAYAKCLAGVILPKGSTILNKGILILVADKIENGKYVNRIDIPNGQRATLTSDKAVIQALSQGGNVEIEVLPMFLSQEEMSNFPIDGKNILNDSITPNKTSFFIPGSNLFNPNDPNVEIGKYIISSGTASSASYNTTGYIPIIAGETYQLVPLDKFPSNLNYARFSAFYDKDLKMVGSIFNNQTSLTAPQGAVFLRVSYHAVLWNDVQITNSKEPLKYEAYKLVIPSSLIKSEKMPSLENFYIPKDIYVASGRTIELYYSQILLNYQKYNIKAQCSIGASLERKFQIKGDNAHIGNYPLTISVYDDNGNFLASASTTIHIMDASVSNMAILPIGDSLTNAKKWLQEVQTLSSNAITFVGTRKTGYVDSPSIRHEGRSGGTCSMYNTDSVPYTYADNGYDSVGADAATFDSSKSYAVGDFCKYGDAVYVFTSAHSGAWNASHVRNISQSNPFWDWANNKFSINHYKSFYGIDYNAIMIFLGTNGISLTPETNENGALGIKTLVENIRKEDTTTPIIVVNTIYRSGQNGIGTQGNTDGYKAQSEFKFDADRKVMLLAKAVEDMIGGMENVYICPVGFTHDSQYNFGNVKKEVNPRLTDTSEVFELFPLDSVHPQECGYLQMADEMFSTLCNL